MDMTPKEYQAYVKEKAPSSPIVRDCLRAFLVGGLICALGQRARSDVADALRDSAPFVRIIGDAHRVSTITNAVYEGYHAALDI